MLAQRLAKTSQKARKEAEARWVGVVKDVTEAVERRCLDAAADSSHCATIDLSLFDERRSDMPPKELRRGVAAALTSGGCTVAGRGSVLEISWPELPDSAADAAGNVRGKCPVCHELTLLVALVPCGHSVCRPCLETAAKETCPTCRGDVARGIPMFVEEVEGMEQPGKKRRVERAEPDDTTG
mmetsp:Transcript_18301/g.42142  ORF Transcript_18301/g.42142 Transcript_18301/m.42142 type:complete len:183 (-) Transcript_18301:83-631(-)|eukprot:CAMPEP_0204337390 /NCGR_PEP_ID=MMETSP0469-20131031/20268_1 /ASSEMBLY_ACC=CAM_ASM_000384 /TAXON_ID=2969 /ORGANISM="Oxyrrhis marina" /LENGTH=182 /DNA_ID=CAMNT_0051321413 /DNA_START=17 /DNA_END=562 /DNA_ORIENTATION=-